MYKNNDERYGTKDFMSFEVFKSVLKDDCYYCGRPEAVAGVMGIDRVNSSLGHEEGNIVACCAMCNRMKSVYDQTDFIQRCAEIADRHGSSH